MLFHSIDFAIFVPVVFVLYWFVTNKSLKAQNWLIVVASYVFYGWWDYRFLSLIFFTTLLDYIVGIGLSKAEKPIHRKLLLATSMTINLGMLGFYKYFNFFIDNFITAFTFLGMPIQANTLDIILPVGISFYTFQTLSYVIDVYRRQLEPTKNLAAFIAFVTFFPQLVAGPIERATNLLPQFYKHRTFDYGKAVDGMRQILWGLFKKIVIADNCADFANKIFGNYDDLNGSTLVFGAIFFTFQIYCDFSGYSDIAIGTARLFGFDLMRNFSFPYFSRDIAEFWRRWHISLSTWFRDYVYIPLGGSKGGTWMKVRNTFIIFLLSGFWHGANWTFIAWGALNAMYFLPLLLTQNNRANLDIVAQGKNVPSFREFSSMLVTFGLTVFAWIFFRADNMGHAMGYISGIFSASLFKLPNFTTVGLVATTNMFLVLFVLLEWFGRQDEYAIEKLGLKWKRPFRHAFYYALIAAIVWFGGKEQEFIYFQF